MYSKCLFCYRELGENREIEKFPIGRRLAFDEAKGRLWVVCTSCSRWNLTPVEERWEAIEDCERRFRATKLRLSTDEIGLARLSEGLDLVRIGRPQKPEMAAWRYSNRFKGRRRRAIAATAARYGIVAGIFALNPIQLLSLPLQLVASSGTRRHRSGISDFGKRIVARLETVEGTKPIVTRAAAQEALLLPPNSSDSWGLRISTPDGFTSSWRVWHGGFPAEYWVIRGEAALELAGKILPAVNFDGGGDSDVRDAVTLLGKQTDPHVAFARAAAIANRANWEDFESRGLLAALPAPQRLALEMISHEDTERRALEGELYLLEDAWREAEEIAAISDNMFLPKAITDGLAKLKARKISL